MHAADAVQKLATDMSKGMVLKAALIYDYIDEDGQRQLSFACTEDMTLWDLDALLGGVQKLTAKGYNASGG